MASCSFHLRMLAKYGFIELDTRSGREKPWRLVAVGRDIRPDDDDPDSVRAVEAMGQLALEHAAEHIRRWIARLPVEPAQWTEASTLASLSLWLTVDELAELSRTIQGLADRFDDRNLDPAARPVGARPVRVFGAAHVDIDRERRATVPRTQQPRP